MSVKVILRQNVPNLGEAGEVKQVKPGYFRNFLLPRGLAVEATEGQLKSLHVVSTVKAGQAEKRHAQASAVAGQLGDTTITIPVRLGEQGRIYGSVTNKDIAAALQEQGGLSIDRHKIELREPLKAIGAHTVPVKLEKGVEANVNVELVPATETTS